MMQELSFPVIVNHIIIGISVKTALFETDISIIQSRSLFFQRDSKFAFKKSKLFVQLCISNGLDCNKKLLALLSIFLPEPLITLLSALW